MESLDAGSLAGQGTVAAIMVGFMWYLLKTLIPKMQADYQTAMASKDEAAKEKDVAFIEALDKLQTRFDGTIKDVQTTSSTQLETIRLGAEKNSERQTESIDKLTQSMVTLNLTIAKQGAADPERSGEFRVVDNG